MVVCTYNRSDLLKDALAALAEQTLDPERYEVLLIDNNSADDTAEVANQHTQQVSNNRNGNGDRRHKIIIQFVD